MTRSARTAILARYGASSPALLRSRSRRSQRHQSRQAPRHGATPAKPPNPLARNRTRRATLRAPLRQTLPNRRRRPLPGRRPPGPRTSRSRHRSRPSIQKRRARHRPRRLRQRPRRRSKPGNQPTHAPLPGHRIRFPRHPLRPSKRSPAGKKNRRRFLPRPSHLSRSSLRKTFPRKPLGGSLARKSASQAPPSTPKRSAPRNPATNRAFHLPKFPRSSLDSLPQRRPKPQNRLDRIDSLRRSRRHDDRLRQRHLPGSRKKSHASFFRRSPGNPPTTRASSHNRGPHHLAQRRIVAHNPKFHPNRKVVATKCEPSPRHAQFPKNNQARPNAINEKTQTPLAQPLLAVSAERFAKVRS